MFGLRVNKITGYNEFVRMNYEHDKRCILRPRSGEYIIEINIVVDNCRSFFSEKGLCRLEESGPFHYNLWSGPENPKQNCGEEIINYENKNTLRIYRKKIEIEFNRGMVFAFLQLFILHQLNYIPHQKMDHILILL